MLKDTSYKEKFILLKPWMPSIVETVKKDLKNDHLKNDWQFCKKYIGNKNIHKISIEELADAYSKAMETEDDVEELGEFISNRWLMRNTEIYGYFEEELKKIADDFTTLEVIDASTSHKIVDGSVEQFGAPRTYLFSVINAVVFPKEVYEKLEKTAGNEVKAKAKQEEEKLEQLSMEARERTYQQQIKRLTDNFEKKLIGLEKKYHTDVTALKKQIACLQKKVQG